MIRATDTPLPGVTILEPVVHGDERGFFVETYRREDLVRLGIDDEFVQQNQSRSIRGTLRGLHFQTRPGQSKLVRVARGAIWDVVVDIRSTSPTFGHHLTVELDDTTHRQVHIPAGFAHGFCVTSEVADVTYLVSSYYDASLEKGIAWNDPELAITWPTNVPILSDRDRSNSLFSDLAAELNEW